MPCLDVRVLVEGRDQEPRDDRRPRSEETTDAGRSTRVVPLDDGLEVLVGSFVAIRRGGQLQELSYREARAG